MAVHGVSRATRDLDVLAMSTECLDPETWSVLERAGATVGIRRGDADDPLAGAVRIMDADASVVEVLVGRTAWQREALHRATVQTIEGAVARGLWARIVAAR
jgi:hypothetical protein